MAKRLLSLVTAMLFITTPFVLAKDAPSIKKVFEEKGSIYYCPSGKQKIQLTKSGKDRNPILSPNGEKMVFIRKSSKMAYNPIDGADIPRDPLADQLWIMDINGKNEKMLVQDINPDDKGYDKWKGEDVIGFIEDESVQFSPDGKTVYYLTPAWVTSSALRSVNVDGTREHFITSANYLKVIDKGQYKGDLIISQHRYFLIGGSYDWYYVFTSKGKEVGPLADDLNHVDWDFLYFEDAQQDNSANKPKN